LVIPHLLLAHVRFLQQAQAVWAADCT
jgi:hypothetical protein